jgi:lauroyl/myristoyl acyltransferase
MTRADSDLSAIRWHAGALNNGLIFGTTLRLVRNFPRGLSYAIGHAGTWLAFKLMAGGTHALIENLRVVRPDASDAELSRLALLTYRSYAKDTIDFIRSLDMDRTAFMSTMASFDDASLDRALERGRGAILVGGHFGNWELGGIALRLLRTTPLTVVAKSEASAAVGVIRRRMREAFEIDTIEIGQTLDTALQIRSRLSANGLVAMLLDRHLGRDRVDVTFFGRSTPFLRTPAMIGYLSGAPLLPAFMIRRPDNRFAGVIGDPIEVDASRPTDEAVAVAIQSFATQLEAAIRENPQLWYQFYPYWSAAPR